MASDNLNYFSDQLIYCVPIDAYASNTGCSCCCCCPCNGIQPKFIRPEFYHRELAEIVPMNDLYSLLDACDEKIYQTGYPLWLCGIVAGLSMVGVIPWCIHYTVNNNRRKKGLDKLVAEWNERHRAEGVYVEWNTIYYGVSTYEKIAHQQKMLDVGLPGLNIKVNRQAREAYLSKRI